MHGGDINFQISPPSRIMESCDGTIGVVSLLRELLVLLIPRLDQVLSRLVLHISKSGNSLDTLNTYASARPPLGVET